MDTAVSAEHLFDLGDSCPVFSFAGEAGIAIEEAVSRPTQYGVEEIVATVSSMKDSL